MPFADYLAEAVLEPLGMTRTDARAARRRTALEHASPTSSRFVAELRAPTPGQRGHARRRVHGAVPGAGRYRARRGPLRIRARGAWGSRSAATSRRTGRAPPIRRAHVRPLRRRRHDDLGRPRRRRRALVALTDRPFDDVGDRGLRRGPSCPTRCSPRSTGVTTFSHGDRVRVGDHRRRRPAARPLRLRRRGDQRRRSGRGDARRRARRRRHRPRPRSSRCT